MLRGRNSRPLDGAIRGEQEERGREREGGAVGCAERGSVTGRGQLTGQWKRAPKSGKCVSGSTRGALGLLRVAGRWSIRSFEFRFRTGDSVAARGLDMVVISR